MLLSYTLFTYTRNIAANNHLPISNITPSTMADSFFFLKERLWCLLCLGFNACRKTCNWKQRGKQ